jgi:hypothetical protein
MSNSTATTTELPEAPLPLALAGMGLFLTLTILLMSFGFAAYYANPHLIPLFLIFHGVMGVVFWFTAATSDGLRKYMRKNTYIYMMIIGLMACPVSLVAGLSLLLL